jgi:plastocyanin
MNLLRVTAVAAAAASLAFAGCGSDGDAGSSAQGGEAGDSAAPRRVTVKIASYKFVPETVRVRAGGSVTWENEDDVTHDAQTDAGGKGAFDTQALTLGDTKRVTIDRPGRYAFYCSYHRFMEGTVEVVPDGR